MKKLAFLLIAATIFGCAKKDHKAEAIKARIIQNAMGQDIGYKPIGTTKVVDVTQRDMLDVFLIEMEAVEKPIDTLIMATEAARSQQKASNNVELYHLFDYYVGKLKDYQAANDEKEIIYSVYKHDYSIINPLFNNAKVNISNYYFFSPSDSLLGYVGDQDYKEFKKNFIQHDAQPYEKMLYSFTAK